MNQPRPAAMNASPMLETFVSNGIGMGMRSAIGPAIRKNWRLGTAGSSTWNPTLRSAVPILLRSSDGPQTGMKPPLTTRASPLAATPTITAVIPGRFLFGHRPASQQQEGRGIERQSQRVGQLAAVGDQEAGYRIGR